MFDAIGSAIGGIAGAFIGAKSDKRNTDANIENQRDFAQQGIQWKVADARAAGIHPLYALGANTNTFSPVPIGGTDWGAVLSNAGQNIGRSIDSTRTQKSRDTARQMEELTLERARLENEVLRSQNTQIQRSMNPPMAGSQYTIPGQTASGVDYQDAPRATVINATGKEGGSTADWTYSRTSDGGLTIIPSDDVKDNIEDMLIPEMGWSIRNTHILRTPPTPSKEEFPLPPGYIWRWYNLQQKFKPYKVR